MYTIDIDHIINETPFSWSRFSVGVGCAFLYRVLALGFWGFSVQGLGFYSLAWQADLIPLAFT